MTSLDEAIAQAKAHGVARLDAQQLLAHLLAQSRTWVMAHGDHTLPATLVPAWRLWLARRADGEPLAYLLGKKEFHGLMLRVTPEVLVPRADTETLVEWALEHLALRPAASRVVDLGTGSGAIALAVQYGRPQTQVWATDISPAALSIAQANATQLGLPVQFRQGSWWQAVPGQRFDLALSNPPYIAEGDPHLPALRHEPCGALVSGPTGLDALRRIIQESPAHLQAKGWLLLEHGHDQENSVQHLLATCGFIHIETRRDIAGQPRCTAGQWPGSP